jgi:formiminotetrahydrofolate cyclodeaminase
VLDQTATIDAFLTATAAAHPTPGGGSVAALTGALAAALGEMVLNYSVNKKDLAAHKPELAAALAEMTRARRLLLGLMAEDQQAYAALSAARKDGRAADQTVALAACLAAPQAVAAAALAVLDLCDRVADKVNRHLLSDLVICADLAMATVRCSMHNIRVNLADVTDAAQRAAVVHDSGLTFSHALTIIQRFSRRSL